MTQYSRGGTPSWQPAPIAPPPSPQRTDPLVAIGRLARVLVVLLVVHGCLTFIGGLDATRRAALDGEVWADDADPTTLNIDASPAEWFTYGVEQLATLLAGVCVVLWCVWQTRLLRLVHPASQRSPTVWAIGSWFVPVVNLWMPLQHMGDLWQALRHPWQGLRPGELPRPRLLTVWWLSFVAALAMPSVVNLVLLIPGTQAGFPLLTMLRFLARLASVAMAVQVVRAITQSTNDATAPRLMS